LSAVQSIAVKAPFSGRPPRLDVDPNGNAVFSWVAPDSLGFIRNNTRVRSATGTLTATQVLSDPGADSPRVGVDAGTNAVFVWTQGASGCGTPGLCYRIQTRSRSAGGTLSAVRDLSTAGQNAIEPQVGVAANGVAAADWRRFDGTTSSCCYRVQGAAGP
jgi:hypothetical protein